MSETTPSQFKRQPATITKHLAFVIDGEVQVIMGTDDRHAAVFLSDPTVVEFTPSAENTPQLGWKWDGTNLIPPVSE